MSQRSEIKLALVKQSDFKDWLVITKPRIMSLAVFTAFVGIIITPKNPDYSPLLTLISLLAIALGAAAAGIYNMYFERESDKLMLRTKRRPIVLGSIESQDALCLANFLSLLSVGLLGLSANWFSAFLLALTIFFYAVIYTVWLKPNFSQNIVIGGISGALPPIIGASVVGSIGLIPIYCFLLIFLWTPPHFWSLSIIYEKDYKAASIPMMNVVHGAPITARYCLIYTLILLISVPIAYYLTSLGIFFLVFSLILNSIFVKKAYDFYKVCRVEVVQDKINIKAKELFLNSIFYLFCSFFVILIDQLL